MPLIQGSRQVEEIKLSSIPVEGELWTDASGRLYMVKLVGPMKMLYEDCYPDGETVERVSSTIAWECAADRGEIWRL